MSKRFIATFVCSALSLISANGFALAASDASGKAVPASGTMSEFAVSPSVLTIFVLASCLTCIYMVFFFGRRLQSTAYLRESLIEGSAQLELKGLLRELHDQAMEGPLDPKSPPPEGYGPTGGLWEPYKYKGLADFGSPPPFGDETLEQKQNRMKEQEERRQQTIAFRKWESDEKVRYETRREQLEKLAL